MRGRLPAEPPKRLVNAGTGLSLRLDPDIAQPPARALGPKPGRERLDACRVERTDGSTGHVAKSPGHAPRPADQHLRAQGIPHHQLE